MKKAYTKKQIKEAIVYWKKQLRAGNYRKINEDVDHGQIKMDIEDQLAERDDIPNYLKSRIHDLVIDNVGYDGIEYDSQQVDIYANSWKRERVITVTVTDGTSGSGIKIPTNAVPLKVTPDQISDYVHRQNPNAQPLLVEIKFDDEVGTFVYGFGGEFDDDGWIQTLVDNYETPIDLGADGNATRIYCPYMNRVYTVDDSGVMDY